MTNLEDDRADYTAWLPGFLDDVERGCLDAHLATVARALTTRRNTLTGAAAPTGAGPQRVRQGGPVRRVDPRGTGVVLGPQRGAQHGPAAQVGVISDPPDPYGHGLDPNKYPALEFVQPRDGGPYPELWGGGMTKYYSGAFRYFTLDGTKYLKDSVEGRCIVLAGTASVLNGAFIVVKEIKTSKMDAEVIAFPRTARTRYDARTRRILAAATNHERIVFPTSVLSPYV